MNSNGHLGATFAAIRNQRVRRHETSRWNSYIFDEAKGFPLVVEAIGETSSGIATLIDAGKDVWESALAKHGVIFFRGFGVDSSKGMEAVARLFLSSIIYKNPEHTTKSDSDFVQRPVDYDKRQFLLWHSENTFNKAWPGRILFACERPADKDGETVFVDNRAMYEAIDKSVRDQFEKKGVMYVRRYTKEDTLGRGWKTIFLTDDKSCIEETCRKQNMRFEWLKDGSLVTRAIRPAVWMHRSTNQLCWINQAQHWHFSCLPAAVQASLKSSSSPENYPRNCYFGDGSEISADAMGHILQLYRANQVYRPWERGDFTLIDNAIISHARRPYEGERSLLVVLGDTVEF